MKALEFKGNRKLGLTEWVEDSKKIDPEEFLAPLIRPRGHAEDAAELGRSFFDGKTAKAVVHWKE